MTMVIARNALTAAQRAARPPGLGDKIEKIIKPVAVALKLPCLDEHGNLKPESPCAKRKLLLNKIKPLTSTKW